MTSEDLKTKIRELKRGLVGSANRIRRYALDPRLRVISDVSQEAAQRWDAARQELEALWTEWTRLHEQMCALDSSPEEEDCMVLERAWLQLDHRLDLVQRELVAPHSFASGTAVIVALSVVFVLAVYWYLVGHGMTTSLHLVEFEPWPEWGPLKYFEVAYWAFFGVLCSLLFTASWFVSRRDFDHNFVTWYVSTALRAPLMAIIVMMVVLEFVEWYGEGGWLETYILEEGNKYYFIVFVSFCLGIASESTATTLSDLAAGVGTGIQTIVRSVAQRFGAVLSHADVARTP